MRNEPVLSGLVNMRPAPARSRQSRIVSLCEFQEERGPQASGGCLITAARYASYGVLTLRLEPKIDLVINRNLSEKELNDKEKIITD